MKSINCPSPIPCGHRKDIHSAGFIDKVQRYYSSGLNYVDFAEATEQARQRINNWVEEKTNQRIKDMIKPGDIDSLTRLVLTNAIYFKGNWAKSFDPSLTKKETFYVVIKQEKTSGNDVLKASRQPIQKIRWFRFSNYLTQVTNCR